MRHNYAGLARFYKRQTDEFNAIESRLRWYEKIDGKRFILTWTTELGGRRAVYVGRATTRSV